MKGWTQAHADRFKDRKPFIDPGINQVIDSLVADPLLKRVRRQMKHEESDLQINCVKAFRLVYPRLKMRLFSIPNGGYRNAITASILVAEGSYPGVLDLMLAIPKRNWAGLFIEMKATKGRLSDAQIAFIKEIQDDYCCVVCRTVEQFLNEVKNYLG